LDIAHCIIAHRIIAHCIIAHCIVAHCIIAHCIVTQRSHIGLGYGRLSALQCPLIPYKAESLP
jgi:hypothetical protein